ncbi:TetR/AcrR family transcriptional regulator [Micromonospora sp. NPDC049559]|uniref:TetR/AcrR family transcriptional regulator n=1 Tax=Micromonospora sp. NPDC049559 TaxID=3155923 RepID=UPI0034217C41
MRTFWLRGYQGTSMSDLTAAMGMNAPSIYAAFGDKEELFEKVVERYLAGPGAYLQIASEQPTPAALVRTVLRAVLDTIAGEDTPPGCLTVHGALAVNPRSSSVQQLLQRARTRGEVALTSRFEAFQQDGRLPAGSNPSALARLLITVIQGLAVQAASGASREALEAVCDQLLACWPETDRAAGTTESHTGGAESGR